MSRDHPGPSDSPTRQPRCAIVLVNIGTPSAPNARALRRYLSEFLIDRRVIELPRLIWLPVLYGVILPLRAGRSAHAYRSIWLPDGSPLRVHSQSLATALEQTLGVPVRLAMRYGEPSVASVLRGLRDQGLDRLLVLPLYPQYSATTTASAFDALTQELRGWRRIPELRSVADYHDEAAWLDAVATSIRRHWDTHPRGERLLLSFHGIPQRYVDAGDPYFEQCRASAQQIAARLGLNDEAWQLCFQSRVGGERWLQPYTEETLIALAKQGVRRVDVACPGFAVDCLETLEEIALRYAEIFRRAGGTRLTYVPALNASEPHVRALATLLRRHGAGWPEFDDRGETDPHE